MKAMGNHLAHRYFDTAHAIVADTVAVDLPPLVEATNRLFDSLTPQPDEAGARTRIGRRRSTACGTTRTKQISPRPKGAGQGLDHPLVADPGFEPGKLSRRIYRTSPYPR
jgi:hypothetical protein